MPICSDFKHGNSILRRDVFASGTDDRENGQFIEAWIICDAVARLPQRWRVNGRQSGSCAVSDNGCETALASVVPENSFHFRINEFG